MRPMAYAYSRLALICDTLQNLRFPGTWAHRVTPGFYLALEKHNAKFHRERELYSTVIRYAY